MQQAMDEDWLDPEGPSAEDLDRFDPPGRSCPACGAEMADLATVCPECGEILDESGTRGRWHGWAWRVVAVVLLVAFVLWYVL
jgi:predicted nucleic acid-binding Zn ribbon protein